MAARRSGRPNTDGNRKQPPDEASLAASAGLRGLADLELCAPVADPGVPNKASDESGAAFRTQVAERKCKCDGA
jgi:hypothetical protein